MAKLSPVRRREQPFGGLSHPVRTSRTSAVLPTLALWSTTASRSSEARLGWISAALALLSVASSVAAVYLFTHNETRAGSTVALLPVNVEINRPGLAIFVAALAGVAAAFMAIAAVQVAAAMRVLSPDRHLSRPLPPHLQQERRWVLGPLALRALEIEHLPEWPVSAVPTAAELPPGTPLRCTVLVPAHDEEAVLGLTLDSLAAQSRAPDRVVVVADNCSDATVDVARAHGVEVVETVGNTEKKAGALNQQLARMLPDSEPRDVVMVMDADSTISVDFLEVALGLLERDADLMAVGGLFFGEDGAGLIGQLQRNEFSRYQRVVARRLDRVFVLTGTASVMRVYALRAVSEARGSLIPGPPGKVYDTLAMTEDNELTLALKSLGARLTSPPQCRVTTEVMTGWHDLWRQRLRWHRGALENIGAYGLTRATAHVLGPAAGADLRGDRAVVVPGADDHQPPGRGRDQVVGVLADDRPGLPGRTSGDGVGGRVAWPRTGRTRCSSSSGTRASSRHAS